MSSAFGEGDRVGSYRLLRLLGGGMSSVFEAVRVADGTRVALKILRNDRFANDVRMRERFAREVRAQRAARHSSLPELVEAGEIDGVPYLCTKFIDGMTLAAHIEGQLASGRPAPLGLGRDGVASLCTSFAQLADALHALHEAGFVHRDVKPVNVLVDTLGHAWLLDLGLVRMEDDSLHRLTRTGHVVGTPTSLAPEQLDPSRGRIGPRTDVHGLAATFQTCLTLRHPYAASSPAAVFDRILYQPPADPRDFVPDLSQNVIKLLRRALAKDPADRHPSARALAEDLRRVAADRAPRRRPLHAIAAVRRRMRHAGREATAIAILVIFGMVVPGEAGGQVPSPPVKLDATALDADIAEVVARLTAVEPPWPDHEATLVRAIADAEALLARRSELASAIRDADPGQRELFERAVRSLQDLSDRDLPEARERRAWADTIGRDSIVDHAHAWEETAALVAADPRFHGLRIEAQVGLVPLGADPSSRLCEFHHLASAERGIEDPRRDAAGRLVLGPEHGIILVLVPPTSSEQRAFLIGKHEVTRAQWMRLARCEDPSDTPIGVVNRYGSFGPTHPVDRVSWSEAVHHLGRWGLSLPTRLHWQHAAVAGDPARFPGAAGLGACANIVDRSFVRLSPRAFEPETDDGFGATAPVGSFAANDFGLYDTFGNVWEWTAELDKAPIGRVAIARGGAYDTLPADCRTDYRFPSSLDQRLANVGLRAMRELR